MYFNCIYNIIITDQNTGDTSQLLTVFKIETHNESREIGSDCEIEVPLLCRIRYSSVNNAFITDYPQRLFNVGDGIIIQAQYEGFAWVNVFTGFIWDFIEGNPLKIKCLDYMYYLQQGLINKSHLTISIQNLVQDILPPQVTLLQPTLSFILEDISFVQMSPLAILQYLKKNIGLNISLMGNKLYMNVASNTTTQVVYNSWQNIIKAELQKPNAVYKSFKVQAHFLNDNGQSYILEIGNPEGILKECFFYNVQNTALYQNLAENFLFRCKQEKYSGNVETYLYPDCQLFQTANYTDQRYPDRTGIYVITGINIILSDEGFHRKLKWSYLDELTSE